MLASVVVPIAGAIIAFVSARDSFPDFGDLGPTDETTYLPGQAPGENGVNVHTVEGYDEMVDALRDETGATYVFNAVIYPRYAVLNVPTGVNERYEAFYWDGSTMEKNTSRGTSSDGQIDMAGIEPELLISALDTVRNRLDSPDSWYVNMYNNAAFGVADQRQREQQLRREHHADHGARRDGHLRLRGQPVGIPGGPPVLGAA